MAADRFDAIIVGGGHKGCEAAAGAVSAIAKEAASPPMELVCSAADANVRNIFGRL